MRDPPSSLFLAGPYGLGALSPSDRDIFERHLPLCQDCQREVQDARVVAMALGQVLDPVAPPAALRARVIAAVGAGEAGGAGGEISARRSSLPAWLAVAATLVAAVAGTVAWTAQRDREAARLEARTSHEQAAALEQQIAAMQMQAAGARRALDVLTAIDMTRTDLAGQPAAPAASGRVYWSASQGLMFAAADLPPLPPGRVYQLWVVSNRRRSAPRSSCPMRRDATPCSPTRRAGCSQPPSR